MMVMTLTRLSSADRFDTDGRVSVHDIPHSVSLDRYDNFVLENSSSEVPYQSMTSHCYGNEMDMSIVLMN